MKKLIAISLLCLSTSVFATDKVETTQAINSNIQLASEKVDAYNNALDAPLLKKLKKGKSLTTQDMARLEIIYQMKYVGEEELNATQAKIYPYTKKLLSKKTRAYIEKHAKGEGM